MDQNMADEDKHHQDYLHNLQLIYERTRKRTPIAEKLAEDRSPTYLGITFDKRLTWKHQIQTAEVKAKTRLALMRRLAGTSWDPDLLTLKKVYTGYVRPSLEYGAATW